MPKVDNFRVSDFARPIANDVVNGTGIQGNTQTKRHSNLFFEAVRQEYGNSLADAIKDENNSGHLTQEEVLNTAQLEKINDKVNNTSKKEIKAGCKRLQNIPESMRRKIEAEVRAKLTDEFLANFLLGNDGRSIPPFGIVLPIRSRVRSLPRTSYAGRSTGRLCGPLCSAESREIDQRLHQVWNDDPNGVPDCDELNDIGRTSNFKSQATTRFGNWRVSMQATRNDSGRAKMRWWMTWNSTDTDDRKTSNRKTIHCFVKWIEEEYGSAVANKVFEEGGVLHSRMKAGADLTSGLIKRTIEDARRLSVSAEFVNSDWAAGQVPTAENPVEAGLRNEFESLWNGGMPRVSRQLRLAWKGKSLFRITGVSSPNVRSPSVVRVKRERYEQRSNHSDQPLPFLEK